jgi:transglutaminase-like putative cysteine protease
VRARITHRTHYRFDRPTRLSPHEIRLRPAPHSRTPTAAYTLAIGPAHHLLHWQYDSAGNQVARVVFQETASELTIGVNFEADLSPYNPFDFLLDPSAERRPIDYSHEAAANLTPYLQATEHGPRLLEWLGTLEASQAEPVGTLDFLLWLNLQVAQTVKYLVRHDPGVQDCEATLAAASGSCRDSGWLLVQLMRHCGIAARFVSGYLVQLAGLTHATGQKVADATDRVDLHAWTEAYLPGAGWIGFDATSGLLTAEGHIPVAVAATHQGAAPVSGSVEPSAVQLEFDMKLTRIDART